LVTGPELERLRVLACPHIRNSPYWEDFISHRVLACSNCQKAGLPLGERQSSQRCLISSILLGVYY